MPFTLAHPAAVVPLRRRLGPHASLSALVVGSMTPDLAYFVPIGVTGAESHSLGGLVWYCLPAGLLAYAAFHALARPLALGLLPAAARARLGPAVERPAASLPMAMGVVASLLVGAASHLAWDSFTHATGWAVQALPLLRSQLHVSGRYLPVWSLLQYAGSLAGLALLWYWARRWYAATDPAEPAEAGAPAVGWRLLAAAVLLIPPAAVAAAAAWRVLAHAPDLVIGVRVALSHAAFASGSVFLASLTVTSVAWRLLAGSGARAE